MPVVGYFGTGPYGTGTYGGIATTTFRLIAAEAVNPYVVRLTFDDNLDPTYPATFQPSNYTIAGLTINRVVPDPLSPASLYLYTSVQSYQLYTVVVDSLLTLSNIPLDGQHRSAIFTGYSTEPCFTAVAVGPRRLRLIFVRPMQVNAALLDVASYAVKDVAGVFNVVQEVTQEQPGSPTSLVLRVASDLSTTEWNIVEVSNQVVTTGFLSLIPRTATFQWVNPDLTVTVPLSRFTGEVQGGLFGTPLGQVFFSPALEAPIANSAIEVQSVDVCTAAYDTYEFPAVLDPFPLYTWQSGVSPRLLNGPGVVLWAAFPRLMEATITVDDLRTETMPVPEDGPADAYFLTWDPAQVAFLNNTYWELGVPAAAGHAPFITANNLIPVVPTPSHINLEP